MKHHLLTVFVLAGLLTTSGALTAQVTLEVGDRNPPFVPLRGNPPSPAAVSPGSLNGTPIGDPCPAFSWGEVAGAKSYDLAVYRVREEVEEAEAVLWQTLPGSALSWTPPLDRCLERGGRFAWTVRAVVGSETSPWAPPSFFEVTAGHSDAEFEAALAVIRRHLAEKELPAEAGLPAGKRSPAEKRSPATRAPRSPAARGPVATLLSVGGNVDAVSFTGDGSDLSNVVAADLSCTGCVSNGEIATDAVGSSEIATGAVGSDQIAAAVVGQGEIADGAVGSDEIATGAVGNGKIVTGAVGSDQIAASAVASSDIAAGAVGTSETAIDAVGGAHIADGGVFSSDIADDAVDSDEIATDAVGSDKIAGNAVSSSNIADDAVVSAKIATGAVRGSELSHIYIVAVQCNGECSDGTLGDVCDASGPGREPIGASAPNEFANAVSVACGGDNRCLSYGDLNRSTPLSSVATDDGPTAWEGMVFCVSP